MPQLKGILSRRIKGMARKTEIGREHGSQALIRQNCKNFTTQGRFLMTWLQLCGHADELEDTRLTGDSTLSIAVAPETDSAIRWFQSFSTPWIGVQPVYYKQHCQNDNLQAMLDSMQRLYLS
jgi:hypothetical protein